MEKNPAQTMPRNPTKIYYHPWSHLVSLHLSQIGMTCHRKIWEPVICWPNWESSWTSLERQQKLLLKDSGEPAFLRRYSSRSDPKWTSAPIYWVLSYAMPWLMLKLMRINSMQLAAINFTDNLNIAVVELILG